MHCENDNEPIMAQFWLKPKMTHNFDLMPQMFCAVYNPFALSTTLLFFWDSD